MKKRENPYLVQEWTVLQNQYDSYEKFSLLIKLISIIIFSSTILFAKPSILLLIIIAILWLQDAIWKTFQARIEPRLLEIEFQLVEEESAVACQFNLQYSKNKVGTMGMIKEYLSQAVRPTIAYPYVVLIGFGLILVLL